MTPHFSLNIVPDILAVQTDILAVQTDILAVQTDISNGTIELIDYLK